jgi:hypothetical protein
MKLKFLNILTVFSVLLIITATVLSCSDMNSIEQQYLGPEKIYAGKLDSLRVFTGYKKIKIVGLTRYLGNTRECIVEWEKKSKIFPIDKITDGKFEMIIDGLEERSYEFKITTRDPSQNLSVIQFVKGKAIGDIFKNSLIARNFEINYTINGLSLNWATKESSPNEKYTTLKYETLNNEIKTIIISPDDLVTPLLDWKENGLIETTATIGSIDLFESFDLNKQNFTFPTYKDFLLNRANIKLASMASDNQGNYLGANPKFYLFNGLEPYVNDIQTFNSGLNSIPHHFTIDLDKNVTGVKYEIRKCRLGLKALVNSNNLPTNQNNPTQIQIWGRPDLVGAETTSETDNEFIAKGWILLYNGPVDGGTKQIVEFDIPPSNLKVQFLRYKVLKTFGDGITSSQTAQLTEMTFFGFSKR